MAFDTTRLLSALLNTGLQASNNPLYQVIYQLIQAIGAISSSTAATTTSPSTTGLTAAQVIARIALDFEGGIPGTTGPQGIIGPNGPPGSDGEDGDSAYILPSRPIHKFGPWQTKSDSTVYQAEADGFAIGLNSGSSTSIKVLTDSSNPPTTIRQQNNPGASSSTQAVISPVRQGDYWEIIGTGNAATVYWLPLVTVG